MRNVHYGRMCFKSVKALGVLNVKESSASDLDFSQLGM